MAQKLMLEMPVETTVEDDGALTICKKCEHLVPKTMLCLWCGEPILFKMPETYDK
ncbi:MAG: hypothetical protein NWE89_12500 [Candidatus Bathyarchaeota archaeon]|nr:hypothetical protein [Candidatus Bathyarchaeota archaeon]